jgi:cytochrome P450
MTLTSIDDLPLLDFETPYDGDVYQRLKSYRDQTPLARTPFGMTLALRARSIETLVGENTRQLETETKMMQGVFDGPIFDFVAQVMLFANGDAHRRRRQPIARTFAFKLMEAMRPKAALIAAELVQERLGAGPVDFLGEIAAQLPARIIADVMGIPRSDLPVFMKWIADTSEAIGFINTDRRAEIEKSLVEFNSYVDGLLANRRKNPTGDFLSDYVAVTAAAGDLSEGEIRAQIVGLILAGSDTTRNSICMILSSLLHHPDQWRALQAEPDRLKRQVVEEGLRFEPVVAGIPRVMVNEIELEGCRLPQGAVVAVSLLSVLRDPEVYAAPDTFNIHRTDHPRWNFAFGAGAHRCAGEALARVEMEETLTTIARLAPKTELIGARPQLMPGAIRSVDQMRVSFA